MQLFGHSKLFLGAITFGLLLSISTPPAQAFPTITLPALPEVTVNKALGAAAVVVVLAALWRYYSKKTEPKRVYPNSDSFNETAWYIWDEIIVGQEEKGERPGRVEIDPENPTQLLIKYEKIEPRGIVGNLDWWSRKVVVPTFAFVVIFQAFRDNILKSLNDLCNITDILKSMPEQITQAVTLTPKEFKALVEATKKP